MSDLIFERINGQTAPLKVGYDACTFDIPVNECSRGEPLQKVGTGYRFDLPEGYDMLIMPRSSTFSRGANIHGYVDNDYTGEVFIVVHGGVNFNKGDYLAQCKLVPRIKPMLIEGKVEKRTNRGDKGFGSTGW